jgi:RimJ/RimL family protein N-acetyltransferase
MIDCPEIHTTRLILRCWRPDDLPAFAAINADQRVMEFLGEPLTREQSDALAERIVAKIAQQGFGFWAVEIADVAPLIGFVGLDRPTFEAPFTPTVEIGWRLDAAYWGHGYATEAARAVLDFGFDVAGLEEIVAFTTARNERSRRVMERIGMSRDPGDDFNHPSLAANDPLRAHVLYRVRRMPSGE